MINRLALVGLLWLAATSASAAEEPSGRVDLYLLNALQNRSLIASRVGFSEGAATCPQDNGILTMSRGTLTLHRVLLRDDAARAAIFEPATDDAYVYRIASDDCQVEIAVSLKTHRDGAWNPLLLPKIQRPGLAEEERRTLQAQLMDRLRKRISESQQAPPSPTDTSITAALDERFAAGALLNGARALDDGVEFENAPAGCVEMLGSYAIDRGGVTFSFLANLPGEVNRFLMERVNLDNSGARLQLTRHGCRLDFTVTKLVRQNGLWLAVALEPRDGMDAERPK